MPGDAPSLALTWAVDALAKAGTLSIIGVYPEPVHVFPMGQAMNKNLTVNMGNCNHRKYIPKLLDLVQNGTIDPSMILTSKEPLRPPPTPTGLSTNAGKGGSRWNYCPDSSEKRGQSRMLRLTWNEGDTIFRKSTSEGEHHA